MCTLLIQRFGGSILGSKRFSEEMLEELRKNPCIASVLSGCYVKFTPEFEKLACRELLKGEKTIHEILREHSIDPEMFGSNRIYSLAHRLRAKGESGCQSEIINVMKHRDLRNNPYVYITSAIKNMNNAPPRNRLSTTYNATEFKVSEYVFINRIKCYN